MLQSLRNVTAADPPESEAQTAASEDNLTRKMASGRETSLKAEGEI